MQFASNQALEALVGRVCLVFAQVEHAAGHVVASAHGDWSDATGTGYLEYSGQSGKLVRWLKNVEQAYPEAGQGITALCRDLQSLKAKRDAWAHSAPITDLFLLMKERAVESTSDHEGGPERLLNSRRLSHITPPSVADVDAFCIQASDAGDQASRLAVKIARLAELEVRDVPPP